MSRVLVTGNHGYIGTVLTEMLLQRGHEVIGLDISFYEPIAPITRERRIRQIAKDVREVSLDDLQGVDAIIHLAALSNDPLGEFNQSLTDDINYHHSVRLAKLAKQAGVRRFVYASSQSMYGVAKVAEELDEDAEKNPVTAYARTKWLAEQELKQLCDKDFVVVCFRPSTVYGASARLRCDIVYNNLVACAFTTGRIEIKSDGTPWRPVVHVRDVSMAFIAGLEAPAELVSGESFNVGIPNGNYTVRQLAEAAQRAVPGSTLVFTGEHGSDSRTYRVSFRKILTVLKEYYRPAWDLEKGGIELVAFFRGLGLTEEMLRGRACNRLPQLKHLISQGKLDNELRWREGEEP